MDDKYNPYEDRTLHTTVPDRVEEAGQREGFNDVIRHYDSVNGFQSPKRLEHIPGPIRPIVKGFILLSVGALLFFFLRQAGMLIMFFRW